MEENIVKYTMLVQNPGEVPDLCFLLNENFIVIRENLDRAK
jgi:hypothetical protein